MLTMAVRAAAVVVTAIGLGLGIAYATRGADPWLVGAVPLACAAWVLFAVYHGYLALRWARWRLVRVPLEERSTAELAIPADVAEPVAFDGVAVINRAQHDLLPHSPDRQGEVFARGLLVAVLPVTAVLLAAIQTVWTTGTMVTVGVVGAELLCMVVLLVLVIRWRRPADQWVRARTRAELMRREQYLRLAGVGPYLHLDAAQAEEVAQGRIEEIRRADDDRLRHLLPPRSETGYWLDELWGGRESPVTAARQRAWSYLHYRVRKQLMWFRLGITDHRRGERGTQATIRVSVVVTAIFVAAQAAYHLWSRHHPDWITNLANVPALVLPPACAFLLAVEELFTHRRLAVSYEQMHAQLNTQLGDLQRLLETSGGEATELGRRFQAAVLHTEAALTNELDRWIMLVQRDAYELEP